MTEQQVNRIGRYFNGIAREEGEVKDISGTAYYFGSELATLRLFKHYVGNDKADCGFSENLNTFYFRLEPSF